jgi:hypothetical protein
MAQLSVDRKQRLRTLENDIRKAASEIQKNGLEIGRYLCEIRDDELWGESHESWNQYLKEMAEDLVGKTFSQAAYLIRAAEISKKLPVNSSIDRTNISATALGELARLAPVGKKEEGAGQAKDYSKIRTQDVARVLDRAAKIADSDTPSVRDVRKAVDIELGIDRTPKREEPEQLGIDLPVYLNQKIGQIEGIIELLADVPAGGWKQLEKSHPQLAKRLATVCDNLAELLRS